MVVGFVAPVGGPALLGVILPRRGVLTAPLSPRTVVVVGLGGHR